MTRRPARRRALAATTSGRIQQVLDGGFGLGRQQLLQAVRPADGA